MESSPFVLIITFPVIVSNKKDEILHLRLRMTRSFWGRFFHFILSHRRRISQNTCHSEGFSPKNLIFPLITIFINVIINNQGGRFHAFKFKYSIKNIENIKLDSYCNRNHIYFGIKAYRKYLNTFSNEHSFNILCR